MSSKGENKIGQLVNSDGDVVMEMIGPPNALMSDADPLSQGIYLLSETVIRGIMPDQRGGCLGGEFGYACEYENEVFRLFPDYQDEWKDEWPKFNFLHKASGLEITWYKWIGRDMKMNRDSISGAEWMAIWNECFASIPEEARTKAKTEHDFENTPEYKLEREQAMSHMFEILMNPKKYGAPPEKLHCDECGKDQIGEPSWTTQMCYTCDDCRKKKGWNQNGFNPFRDGQTDGR